MPIVFSFLPSADYQAIIAEVNARPMTRTVDRLFACNLLVHEYDSLDASLASAEKATLQDPSPWERGDWSPR